VGGTKKSTRKLLNGTKNKLNDFPHQLLLNLEITIQSSNHVNKIPPFLFTIIGNNAHDLLAEFQKQFVWLNNNNNNTESVKSLHDNYSRRLKELNLASSIPSSGFTGNDLVVNFF
jgi:hypothetical protein